MGKMKFRKFGIYIQETIQTFLSPSELIHLSETMLVKDKTTGRSYVWTEFLMVSEQYSIYLNSKQEDFFQRILFLIGPFYFTS